MCAVKKYHETKKKCFFRYRQTDPHARVRVASPHPTETEESAGCAEALTPGELFTFTDFPVSHQLCAPDMLRRFWFDVLGKLT